MADLNAPATKADIQVLEGKLDSAVAQLNERHDMLRTEMQHTYDALVERMDATETKLLQAFYSYAESNQKRVAGIETEGAVLKSRLSSLEERIIEIEKRLNMPPAA
jgi:wobble nucleotide-excising tRNase